ncbi:hypothetical protein [Yoonia sp. R78084]|uniref:hypothetical protein n=1 Tax=Yoonia sp. R78084 TaxID=3093869 RepID=UPI0037DDC60F
MQEFFEACPSLSVFSPTGQTLRLDKTIAANYYVPTLGWQYLFIEQQTGIVSAFQFDRCQAYTSKALREGKVWLEELDFGERQSENESLRDPRFLTLSTYDEVRAIEEYYFDWENLKQFDGWAVGCRKRDIPMTVEDFMTLDDWVKSAADEQKDFEMKAVIIAAFDRGDILPKLDFKERYFKNEKRDAFRAAWKEAAKERPELSKRGPKPLS